MQMTNKFFSKRTLLGPGAGVALVAVAFAGSVIAQPSAETPQAAAQAIEPPGSSGEVMVRRLTESQYRASIAQIFGADVPIVGRFERGARENGLVAIGTSHAAISAFAVEQYHASAQAIAATVMSPENRDKHMPCKPASATGFDASCAQKFIDKFGLSLFRRPISKEESARYLKVAKAAHQRLGGFHEGLQFTLAGMMVAPDFLLRIERAEADPKNPGRSRLDPYSKASRLSFLLTDSSPDAELLRAAGAGELDTDAGLARQADRLIASPAYERAVRSFFWDLLKFDGFNDLSKDTEIYPTYNSFVGTDAQEQTLRTIAHHLVTKRGDYRDLFTTRETFLSRPLGVVYRLPVVPRRGFELTEFPESTGRAGILSHVSLLGLNSHPGTSSPTLRGKFVRETFLCQEVPDPPPDVDFSMFEGPHAVLATARQRLDAHNENPACIGCHKLTDPIGLTLENFDGVGSFRITERNQPIDVSGSLDGVEFSGAVELGKALRDNPQTSECLVQKLYEASVGHEAAEEGPYLEYLYQAFENHGFRLPDLMRAMAVSKTFYAVSTTLANTKVASRTPAIPTNGDPS
jgi:hypothetical protein